MALQFCVVCGQGSNRSTWNNQFGVYVACDFHAVADVLAAIAAAGGSPTVGPGVIDHIDPSLDESTAA